MNENLNTAQSIVQIQAKAKPKIEEIICGYLDGEAKQSILKYLDICKANGVKTPWSATNRWVLKLKKQTIGMIYIGVHPCGDVNKGIRKNVWYTCVYNAPGLIHKQLKKEDLTHIIHNNLAKCAYHKKRCAPLKNITILGKEFVASDNLCSDCGGTNYSILFTNACDKTLYWLNEAFEIKNIQLKTTS